MTTEHKIEWANTKGQSVVATVCLLTERVINADGDRVTVPCCEWSESVTLDGRYQGSDIAPMTPLSSNGTTYANRCGKVAIPTEQMAKIEAARAELRSMSEWVAHQAKIERNARECAEYEMHKANIDRMMTLDGRTY